LFFIYLFSLCDCLYKSHKKTKQRSGNLFEDEATTTRKKTFSKLFKQKKYLLLSLLRSCFLFSGHFIYLCYFISYVNNFFSILKKQKIIKTKKN